MLSAQYFVIPGLQTRDHKTLHRKHKIEQHETHYKQRITKHYAENIRLSNGVTQSYVFCVVFWDPLFVVGLVLLNLMFSV
jgi:hypothetical protein